MAPGLIGVDQAWHERLVRLLAARGRAGLGETAHEMSTRDDCALGLCRGRQLTLVAGR